jgi:hypothetical protein
MVTPIGDPPRDPWRSPGVEIIFRVPDIPDIRTERERQIPEDPWRSPERNKRILKVALLYGSIYIYIHTLNIIKIYMGDLDRHSSPTILLYMHFTESKSVWRIGVITPPLLSCSICNLQNQMQ